MNFVKTHFLNMLKGIGIGIANVIPGFSGGTMAVMLKIYDLFVYSFANIFNDFKNVVKKCWSLFVGILIGILFAMVVIVKLLEVITFITIMFFIGLIFGSMPSIYEKVKKQKINIADIIGFIVAIGVIVALPLIPKTEAAAQYNIGVYIIMFAMGIVCSSAMVIPGVSGSLVLMAFGYYAFFMSTMKEYLVNIFNFSLTNYWGMFITLVCFAIGCVIGLVFISKLITKLTEKYPKTVYYTILGLLVASPFSIIYATLTDASYTVIFDFWTIFFSVISLALGLGLVYLGEFFNKKYNKTIQNDSDIK